MIGNKLLKNWGILRIIRLVGGLGLLIYAIVRKEYLFIALGSFFTVQALLNVSCCCVAQCGTSDETSEKGRYENQVEQYNPDKK